MVRRATHISFCMFRRSWQVEADLVARNSVDKQKDEDLRRVWKRTRTLRGLMTIRAASS